MPSPFWRGARSCSPTLSATCPPGSVGGLVHDDTRFLNRWEMRLEGKPLSVLKSRAVDYYSAAFYLTNPEIAGLRPNTLALRRFRFVGNGLLEQVVAANAGLEPASFELRLACGTDFADLFEMKSVVRDRSRPDHVRARFRRPVGAVLLRGSGFPRSLHGPGRA